MASDQTTTTLSRSRASASTTTVVLIATIKTNLQICVRRISFLLETISQSSVRINLALISAFPARPTILSSLTKVNLHGHHQLLHISITPNFLLLNL
ncbi:hypothetical protein CFO_g1566 [Ceratocystis platani]|uniref:Uncharacterized protein n=1 Tax=Ceratocystis fimbriata f. sp. platani TaxID=88771 RepID=A0A0F8DJN9_CERFI|nr:hypothetical protein CFO_g1566 [Ceratocystis platani]